MHILAAKFIYPQDQKYLYEVLRPFQNLSIQLSFFKKQDFFLMKHRLIREICSSFNIDIPTVHAPTTDVFDAEFMEVIKTIKEIYGVELISIHPQKGELVSALAKLEAYAEIFSDLRVTLAYENFPSSVAKRKWIYLASDMYSKFKLPFLKLTFDTSHLDSPPDCLEEFRQVSDKVVVIHLSDSDKTRQHLALGHGLVPYKRFLEHLRLCNFNGPVVLEYMPEYESKLIEDVNALLQHTKENV